MSYAAALEFKPDFNLALAVVGSLLLHAALGALWAPKGPLIDHDKVELLEDVDLIIQERTAEPDLPPEPPAPPPKSMMDFLKMALPKVDLPSKQTTLDVAMPELTKPKALEMPDNLLEEKLKPKALATMDALDLSKKSAKSMAAMETLDLDKARAKLPLAAPIDLAAVGTRAAPKVPEGLQFDMTQKARRVESMADLGEAISAAERRTAALAASPQLVEATRRQKASIDRFGGRGLSLGRRARAREAPAPSLDAPVLDKKPKVKALAAEKKGVEITGPLAKRKVLKKFAPQFPQWAVEQGINEAQVGIRFYVNRQGDVLERMTLEQDSGYGRLNRLAMSALKRWKFAPLPAGSGADTQWGVITFRFVLE